MDRIGFLDALEDADFTDVDEIIVDIARDSLSLLQAKLEISASRLGRERMRLALPALTRFWEDKGLRRKTAELRAAGWTNWEAANLSAWSYLDIDREPTGTSTWPPTGRSTSSIAWRPGNCSTWA